MFVFLILIPVIFAQDDVRNCPSNLVRSTTLRAHGGRCYEFVNHHHKEWAQARDDCSSKGGNLVVIRSTADNTFIMDSLRSMNFRGNGAWIGLSDSRSEGKWEWVTGESVSYSNWGTGQSSGFLHNQEDCALFKYTDSGHWHDYPCHGFLLVQENYPWICEYKQVSLFVTTTTTPAATQVPITTQPPTTEVQTTHSPTTQVPLAETPAVTQQATTQDNTVIIG